MLHRSYKRPLPSDTLLLFPQGCAVSEITEFGWIPASSTVEASYSCRIGLAASSFRTFHRLARNYVDIGAGCLR